LRNIFVVLLATLIRSGLVAVQGQVVTCCECGSAVVRLCRVSGVKTVAPLEVCTKDKQHAIERFFWCLKE
jgi:hypothetical protein